MHFTDKEKGGRYLELESIIFREKLKEEREHGNPLVAKKFTKN